MTIIKKYYEIEEGLLVGNVSIDGDTGEITTSGHLNLNSLNLNNNFTVSSLGNAILDGTLLVNSQTTLHSLIVNNNSSITGTLTVGADTTLQQDLTISGGDLKTTNTLFNLLNTTAQTIKFGEQATTISIGNSTPTSAISANSNLYVSRNLNVVSKIQASTDAYGVHSFEFDGTYSDRGITRLKGVLEVGQESTFSDDVSIDASLFVESNAEITGYLKVFNNFNINDKFTVAYATGNTIVHGTQNVKGAVDLDSTLNVDSNTTIGGTLGVTGTGSITGNFSINTNKFSVIAASGNTTIAGTLDITGNTSTDGTLDVNGTTLSTTSSKLNVSTPVVTSKVETDDVTLPNARLTAKVLTLGSWTIEEHTDGKLLFKNGGVTKVSITTTGAVTVIDDITSWGTP